MAVFWKPHPDHACEDGKRRTVYIRGEFVPFVGWMATPDTYFSCAAYARVKGARVRGYVTPTDAGQEFRALDADAHKLV